MGFAWALGLAVGSALGAPLAQATDDAVPYAIVAALCLGTLLAIQRRRGATLASAGERTTVRP